MRRPGEMVCFVNPPPPSAVPPPHQGIAHRDLKPANVRGIQSQAMVLAANAPDGSKVRRLGCGLNAGCRALTDGRCVRLRAA